MDTQSKDPTEAALGRSQSGNAAGTAGTGRGRLVGIGLFVLLLGLTVVAMGALWPRFWLRPSRLSAQSQPALERQRLATEGARSLMPAEDSSDDQARLDEQDANYQRLERLSAALDRSSSAESVKALDSTLQGQLGASSRAGVPAVEPVAGEFDLQTAEVHDIRKSEDPSGNVSYLAVLVDAEGRTTNSELTGPEGEQLFRTFELIKKNPLLERLYRGVVMSLLDEALKPAKAEQSSQEP